MKGSKRKQQRELLTHSKEHRKVTAAPAAGKQVFDDVVASGNNQ